MKPNIYQEKCEHLCEPVILLTSNDKISDAWDNVITFLITVSINQ